jgi:hypothetical protein
VPTHYHQTLQQHGCAKRQMLIQGSGFGLTQGSGEVHIGGISAPLTRWHLYLGRAEVSRELLKFFYGRTVSI